MAGERPPAMTFFLTGHRSYRREYSMTSLKTAKLLILAAAGVSFLFSVYLWFLVDKQQGVFVGLWVPSILSFGTLVTSGKGRRHD
jgi:hypothetical protein